MNKNQLLRYLLSVGQVEDTWIDENKKDLEKIVNYIWTAFIYTPQVLKYFDKHLNNFGSNNFTLKDKIKFIHFILKQSKVLYSWLNTGYQANTNRIKDLELISKDVTDNDKKSLWHLAYEYNIIQVDSKQQFSKPKKLSQAEKKKIEELIQETKKKNSNTIILNELNQEIIDELELTLFDISTLESKNEIQYTFLDKNNLKVIYREPYKMKVKFHPSNSVFDKDYFEPLENLYEYQFTSVWDYIQFRNALNQAFMNNLMV